MDPLVLYRFPFLRETGDFVRRYGPTPDALLHGEAYEGVRKDGFDRVMGALGKSTLPPSAPTEDAEALRLVLSYIIAKILVSRIDERYVTKRFALNEAGLVREGLDSADNDVLQEVADELGVVYSRDEEGKYSVHFSQYLSLSADRIGGTKGEWKLVNRTMDRGSVRLDRDSFTRLLMESVRQRFEEELPLNVTTAMVASMGGELAKLAEVAGSQRTAELKGPVNLANAPPCMNLLMHEAASGINLPHHARFAMVTFLHGVGMDEDRIIRIFNFSPDFDDRIARYQVEHITGLTSGTEYSAPKCDTMRSYGLCRGSNILCETLLHPLQYYRSMGRKGSFDLSLRIATKGRGRFEGPRPRADAGQTSEIGPDAVGKWFSGEVSVKDVMVRRVNIGERWYSYADPRLKAGKRFRTLPVTDWELAVSLSEKIGKVARIKGYVTLLSEPYLYLTEILD